MKSMKLVIAQLKALLEPPGHDLSREQRKHYEHLLAHANRRQKEVQRHKKAMRKLAERSRRANRRG